jgi:death-on-curing family protein
VRYLSIREVLELHSRVLEQSGGAQGIRDRGALESSVAQPFQTFGGQELYASVPEKAAALGYFLVRNHPFVDGNKRVGHAALEVTLVLNGFELVASIDEQEQIILALAAGNLSRDEFTTWIVQHLVRGV